MELKYFGSMDCRGKICKNSQFCHEGDAGNRIWKGLQECSEAAEHENL